MKVIKKGFSDILYVYGIYQVSKDIYYLVMPKGYPGLLAIKAIDTQLIENNIPESFTFTLNNDGFKLFSKTLQDEILLERLLECDPEALCCFRKIQGLSAE